MGRNNMGGFKPKLLCVPFDAVSAWPTIPDPLDAATTNEGMVTATGSFTFKTDAGISAPIFLYSTDGEVEYKAEIQGERDGRSFKQTLSFFFPGNLKEMHAFNAMVKNTDCFYIIEDTDGKQIIMGAEGFPVDNSPSFNGGKARADRRGTTYTCTADSNYSAIFLSTNIDMEAVANGGSGTPAQDGE